MRFEVPAPPEQVFPLLCPVREEEWIEGWTGRPVYSESGLAELDGVFLAGAGAHGPLLFLVSRYEKENGRVEYLELALGRWVQRLALALEPVPGGTRVTFTRVYTGLSAEGNLEVQQLSGPVLAEQTAGIARALDRHCREVLPG